MWLDSIIYSLQQFSRSLLEFIELGGLVMWPLFGCCLLMLWLVSRALFVQGIVLDTTSVEIVSVETASVKAAVENSGTTIDGFDQSLAITQPDAIKAAINPAYSWLEQRLAKLAQRQACHQQYADLQGVKLLAMIAPLLGLLGTVSGMIAMFDAGASYGFHDPAVISAGISMAMVTTQTGLFVGLSGALLAFFWQRKLNRLQQRCNELSGCDNAEEHKYA